MDLTDHDKDLLLSDEKADRSIIEQTLHRRMDVSKDLIFHYCSAETLLSILNNKTIRFSEASCMNDGEEIFWAETQFELALRRLRDRDDIPNDTPPISKSLADEFWSRWQGIREEARHFLACFSLVGDSLSQWRAYADDGQGFSIGFCVNDTDVPARFVKVEYDIDVQQSEIMSSIIAMQKLYDADKENFNKIARHNIIHLFSSCCAYKNPAFLDEKEVRACHMVPFGKRDKGRKFYKTVKGAVGQKEVEKGNISYRVSRGRLIPFLDFSFQINSEFPIKEIWMGPRCATPVDDFKIFLNTLGYNDVSVKKAGSKYR